MPDYAPPASAARVASPFAAVPPGVWIALAGVFVLSTAVLATALPLMIYTVTLAAFGLAHVLAELRYVDSRFSPRVGWRLRTGMLALLAGVVTNRALALGGYINSDIQIIVELTLVCALGATVMPQLIHRGWWAAGVGVLVIGAIGVGGVFWPVTTLLALAVLHNVTPVGFLAERLRGRQRQLAMAGCLLIFLIVPGIIASGWPLHWLQQLGWFAPDFGLLPSAGTLENHFSAYLPAALQPEGENVSLNTTISLFAAAVFLQCMHYAVVIHVLPRLDTTDGEWVTPENTVPWPRRQTFMIFVIGAASLLLIGFLASFFTARSVYGLAASVHAWIEIPILLLALAIPFESSRKTGEPAGTAAD